jgi:biotin carboxylase
MATASDLPVVAVVHNAKSVSSFDLAAASAGLCQIGFVVDGAEKSQLRLLRHFGPVADITGLSRSEAAAEVRAFAPAGITTFLDSLILPTASLAEDLGLPYHSADVGATLVDKYRQREALQRAGIPGPRFVVEPDTDVTEDSIGHELAFPVVVKPRIGAASRGITMATDRDQLVDALDRARKVGAGAMILEEYLPDMEPALDPDFAGFVSVESVMGAGKLRHLAVMGKLPLTPPFRESGHFTPSHLSEALLDGVLAMVQSAVEGIGIDIGGLHTEVKLTPAGPRIVEVNGRTGGGGVPDVLKAAGGCSLLEAAMRVALGEAPSDGGLAPCERVGFKINVQPPMWAQRVASVEGLAEVAALPGILGANLLRRPGDPVDWRLGTDENVVNIVGAVADLDQLRATRREVDQLLLISYE